MRHPVKMLEAEAFGRSNVPNRRRTLLVSPPQK
jgi:hypothetical protein